MTLVSLLRDPESRRRIVLGAPEPLRRRMLDHHNGNDAAIYGCDHCVRVAWEWKFDFIPGTQRR